MVMKMGFTSPTFCDRFSFPSFLLPFASITKCLIHFLPSFPQIRLIRDLLSNSVSLRPPKSSKHTHVTTSSPILHDFASVFSHSSGLALPILTDSLT
jgi:hypothetical protein